MPPISLAALLDALFGFAALSNIDTALSLGPR